MKKTRVKGISAAQKLQLTKLLPFALVFLFFGALYALLEKGVIGAYPKYPATGEPYEFFHSFQTISLASSILGLLVATLETFFWSKLLEKRGFGQKLLLKTLLYVSLFTAFLLGISFFLNSTTFNLYFYHPKVLSNVFNFASTFAFWSVIIYIGVLTAITLFLSQISDHLGLKVFRNLLLGSYHQPRVEERIFMFLDMKSSTKIAEELGHITYFKLLRSYYAEMSEAILNYSAEIYQYVGDEIILTWPIEKGIKKQNCLNCFFALKKHFLIKENKYLQEYGLVPQFKAGLHFGEVTRGEIGELKREIIFTGDVLNTTARIQGLCNQYEAELIISTELLEKMNESSYQSQSLGLVELRGKNQVLALSTLQDAKALFT